MLKNCKKKAFAFFVAIVIFACNMPIYASQVSVKGTKVNIRSGPGTSFDILGSVTLGYKIVPHEVLKDKSGNGKTWYRFIYDGKNGYIRSDFCKEMKNYTYDANFESELNIKGFPESYKEGLRDLHENYPNWIFTVDNVNMDFDYAVNSEATPGRTLVTIGAIASYKSIEDGNYDFVNGTYKTYDGGAWVSASKDVIAAYMDPRNFLYDPYIFQFEKQTFNVNIQTLDAVKEMVKGTFLEGKVTTEGLSGDTAQIVPVLSFDNTYDIENLGPAAYIVPGVAQGGNVIGPGSKNVKVETSYPFTYMPKGTYTYAELIFDACRQVNANPYTIVSMILQEQGKDGTDSISGKNKKFPNAYNFGNVNAFASGGLTAIENGLKYASETGSYNRPWNTIEKGIYGLCDFYANSYVSGGQDTFYLKKWNVKGMDLFKHQYMTNVSGAAAEGQLLGNIYDEVLLSLPHEFKIPVYKNMKEEYPIPTDDTKPTLNILPAIMETYNSGPVPNVGNISPVITNSSGPGSSIINNSNTYQGNIYSSQNSNNIIMPSDVVVGSAPWQ